ncbi:hypothetical protein AVEN_42679-2 [Araneus ventricosus]|uniref:Uncharacterized protein n=1 Tax=Araneus ventricosus TaxID=182803 RepID=A0A4Y2BNQ4_ARAVE|nr:hypothetical protein AVEN_42679-2 [Araneus ventricosus]
MENSKGCQTRVKWIKARRQEEEQFEENLVPDKYSFNFGKKKKALGNCEAIRHKRPIMLSDGVILLHDNTHTVRKTQELLQKFKWKVWSHPPPIQPTFGTQSGFQTLIWNKVLFKQWCENSCRELDQWAGTGFLQIGLNILVLPSDKCLNRFCDYVEKQAASMPLNSLLNFLSIVNK